MAGIEAWVVADICFRTAEYSTIATAAQIAISLMVAMIFFLSKV
jgi:hypothetical protein